MHAFSRSLARAVKNARDKMNLTQEQVGELVDTNTRTISSIENGKSNTRMTAFNPSIRVGRQMEKTYLLHHGKTPRQEMQRLFAAILQKLGLEDTQRILNSYPFTLSGGMLQRLMIAAALMCQPSLLVADEATTAIDACNRIGLMRELKSFCKEGMSVLFVTHDLRSASVSDRILVMDRGQIVEQDTTERILNAPKEDYTKYLLNACRLERRKMP